MPSAYASGSLVSLETFAGCSEDEILGLEAQLSLRMPDNYRAYLLRMGHDSGELFRGEDVAFSALPILLQSAREEARAGGWTLPEDAIVILGHQGYRYYFVRGSEGADPTVYVFDDGETSPVVAAPSFCAFLEKWLADASSVGPLPSNVEIISLEEFTKRNQRR